jgi:hypothetical protein
MQNRLRLSRGAALYGNPEAQTILAFRHSPAWGQAFGPAAELPLGAELCVSPEAVATLFRRSLIEALPPALAGYILI